MFAPRLMLAALLSGIVLIGTSAYPLSAETRVPYSPDRPALASIQALATADVAAALDLSPDDVLSVSFGTSDPAGYGVFTTPASSFPQRGTSYLVLSSGFVSSALLPNDHPNTSGELTGLRSPGGGNDMVQMHITLRVPAGATTLSFRFKFLSEEYPEYVGSAFNDGFIVESGTSTFTVAGASVIAPGNIVFDNNGNPITINTAGPLGMTAGSASGTTYDGATPVLRTTMPLPAGATTITLIFSVFDVGDNIFDSTVFLDELTFDTRPLEMVALEADQTVQDWHNSVGLVTGKTTLVRAHLQSTDGQPVSARNVRLEGRRNGQLLPGSPLTAQNSETFLAPAHTSDTGTLTARRRSLDKSLNFRLPAAWRTGTVELQLRREDGGVLDCAANPSTGADCRLSVTFSDVDRPQVEFVRVQWKDGPTTYEPTEADVQELVLRLLSIYPISSLSWQSSEHTYSGPTPPKLSKLNTQLEWKRFLDLCWLGCKRLYYGIVNGPFENGGLADGIPGAVASGYLPTSPWGFLRNAHAHELGHLLGRHHATYCTAEDPSAPPFPYTAYIGGRTVATLGPLDQGQAAEIWGLDTHANTVVDPRSQFELMSYCGYEDDSWLWISKFTYEGLESNINGYYSPSAIAAESPYLVVRGTVDLDHNTAAFDPFGTLTSGMTPPQLPTGDYELQLLDGTNNVLLEQTFSPILMTGAALEAESKMGLFIVPVHANDAIEQARVLHNGVILQQVARSMHPPTVSVLSPNGGEFLNGDRFTIRWSGADLDGDSIRYVVQFSPDGGSSWRTLAVDWPDQTYEVAISDLGHSTQGLVRVVASDGFNTASDVSDGSFTTRNAAPEALILSPAMGTKAYGGEPLHLEGLGTDREDGDLSGSSLVWSSDRDGTLGTGADVILEARDLSPGAHVITLSATDSDGQSASAYVNVYVQPVAPPNTELENTPPVADAGRDTLLECAGPAGTAVTLNGSGSTDADGDTLTYTWREAGHILGGPTTDPLAQVIMARGVHVIELTVGDGHGGSGTDDVTVTIADRVAPSLDVILTPKELWPPNHRLVAIHATTHVADGCDPNPTVKLVSLVSTEPDAGTGDGDTPGDIQGAEIGTADADFFVRSERSGSGDGRFYVACYSATDEAGNVRTVCDTVAVPRDRSGRATLAVEDGPVSLIIFGRPSLPVRSIVAGSVEIGSADSVLLTVTELPRFEDYDGDGMDDAIFSSWGRPVEGTAPVEESGAGLFAHWKLDHEWFSASLDPAAVAGVSGDVLPKQLAVSVRPNPALGVALIHYALPKDCHVRLSLFDVSGRRIAALVDRPMSAGYHEVRWQSGIASASSQVYFYRLETDAGTIRGRFIVMH